MEVPLHYILYNGDIVYSKMKILVLKDIDSDFCVKKGWMVFDYLIKKYGKEYCCNVMTLNKLQLKAVIKDVAKALDVPFEEVNAYTTSIPADFKHVSELLETSEYKWFFDKYPEVAKHALRLEGTPKNVGQHPAGICVTPIPVTDILPVQNAKETIEGEEPGYLSQFEKENCELGGLNIAGRKRGNCWKLLRAA